MLPGRTPTAQEKAYMDAVADIGCIICLLYRNQESPAEIHHVEGRTDDGCHFLILPLCPPHHRHPGKGYVSRADGKKAFEDAYMPEHDLIVVVRKAVELRGYTTISSLSGKQWNDRRRARESEARARSPRIAELREALSHCGAKRRRALRGISSA